MKKIFLLVLLFPSLLFAVTDSFSLNLQSETDISTATQVLAVNTKRNYLMIHNKGSESILIKFGSTISASEGLLLPAGGYYEPMKAPRTSVYIKATTGTQTVLVIEGNE